jgi:protein SCO1/2
MNARRALLGGLVLALVAGGGGLAAWPSLGDRLRGAFGRSGTLNRTEGALEKLDVYGRVPEFSLTERSGRQVTLADLRGKVWVANFVYTQCTETCPVQTAQLARVQAEFPGEEGLRLVSITVDPERDTPAVLARYAERYGAHPDRWLFLTGDKRAIYRLAKEGFSLGVVDPDDQAQTSGLLPLFGPTPALATHGSKGLIIHSARLVLVDRQARIRAYHLPNDEQSLQRLHENVRRLLREKAKET